MRYAGARSTCDGHPNNAMNWRLTGSLILAGLLVWLLAVVPSCGGGTPETAESVLNRGIGPDPESVDPQLSRSTQAQRVLRDLFEGLLSYSADGQLEAGVAERWEISDDGLQYSFWLRPDARWSNGDAVTAEDFVFSFRRLVDPATIAVYAKLLSSVVNAPAITAGELTPEQLGVEARDQRELVISLQRPNSIFLFLLAQPPTFPVHRGSIAEHGERFTRPGNLVSNGAYMLQGRTLGSVLELRRNDYYWDNEATSIDVVRHHVTEEPSNELNRYRTGELDITATVPSDAFKQLYEDRPDELRIAPTLSVYYYGFNLNHPVLGSNPKLREALSLAIERETLAEDVVARGETAAYSFVPPGTHNYEPPRLTFADMSMQDRHDLARRLYAEAGFSENNPLVIEVRYNTSDTHKRVALAIQDMWREVLGFEATLINEEFRVLLANVRAMQITEIFRLNWTGDYDDAYTFLGIFQSNHPSNSFAYSNDKFDELLERAAEQTDLSRRRLYLEEAERVMLADHPMMPLYFYVSKHLVNLRICGWQDNMLDYHYSRHLRFDCSR